MVQTGKQRLPRGRRVPGHGPVHRNDSPVLGLDVGGVIAWLHHHKFFHRTGIPTENLHFVRDRADKAPVCARLRITHFVDDRLDILRRLTTVGHRYLFVGGLGDETAPSEIPPWVTVAETWAELADAIQSRPPGALDKPPRDT